MKSSWLPFLMWWYGYTLVIAWTILAIAFGWGHVEEKTSYGLHDVLIALSFLSGQWATYAFGASSKVNAETRAES